MFGRQHFSQQRSQLEGEGSVLRSVGMIAALHVKIYRDTIDRLSKNEDNKESEFQVLHWITKCYDALIVLSYTLGTIIFLLILTSVINDGEPIWWNDYEWDYYESAESSPEATENTGDAEYSDNDMEYTPEHKEPSVQKHFDEEGFFTLLCLLYFLPLIISLTKEIFSLAIILVIRLGNIDKNTKS